MFVKSDGLPASKGMGYFIYCWDKPIEEGEHVWSGGTTGDSGPFGKIWYASKYALRSRGPNGDWDWRDPRDHQVFQLPWVDSSINYCVKGDIILMVYDPSNGTISFGDIYRTSAKGQW